jgi:hypothetical protein
LGATFITQPVAELPAAAATKAHRDEARYAISVWIARGVIVCVAGALAWYTWGHWGDFQIDNGRELYVPAEILKGQLLFRDLWYMYGPLAAYVNALLFWIFGVHLTVLYVFGLTLAIGCALVTFEIARRFKLGIIGSTVPALFFLVEAFYPFIRNFIFPYSYAAALGAFLGLACLYFVMLHAAERRPWHLAAAAVLSSLVILTKQEIGFACLVLLAFEIAACYLIGRSVPESVRNIGLLAGAHLPAALVYGWFVWKLSARVIFIENWISTPGTYFMRTFSKITMPDQGFRFVPSELVEAAAFTALGVALWALLAYFIVTDIEKRNLRSRWAMALAVVAGLAPLWLAAIGFRHFLPWGFLIHPSLIASFLVVPLTQAIFPEGIFFLVLLFTIHAFWKFMRAPQTGLALQGAGLGVYAALIALRQMMELRPSLYKCAVFFNGPAFLIFVIVLYAVIRRACSSLDRRRASFVAGSLLTAEVVLLFLVFFPKPKLLTTRLTTDYGSFYTRRDVAILFPQIISFMKAHTRNGKDILILPEPPSLYVFAGMEAPSRWYSLVPGYVAPEQEQDYINDLAASDVRYVLISNRSFIEYEVAGFANGGYNPTVYHWIMANYAKVGQFGPVPDSAYPPYIMWVYERKESQPGD